jgi:hypothetical protein
MNGGRHLAHLAWALAAAGAVLVAGASPHEAPALITPEQAQHAAWQGFADKLPLHPAALREAAAGTAAAPPLLVERIDRRGSFYYIVPFTRQGRTTLVVLVDAHDGSFKEAAGRSDPRPYPAIDEARARSILRSALAGTAGSGTMPPGRPNLVWKPSAASQSPYEPIWRFRQDGRTWYVDQQGRLLDQIAEPEMKGGGPPHR